MPKSSVASLLITCGFYNFFTQPKLPVWRTRLEGDCRVMETQSAAIKFSIISTLIYIETISTHPVGKFYFSWHPLYTLSIYFLQFFPNDNSSFTWKAWIIISTSELKTGKHSFNHIQTEEDTVCNICFKIKVTLIT